MVEGRKECKVGWRRNGGVVEGRKEWKVVGVGGVGG